MKAKWTYSGDVNRLAYGGKDMRHIGKRQFQFVELINMDDACGRDNEGQPKYVVELRLVDLDAIPASAQKSALECCGQDATDNDLALAEYCDSYGAHAPLGSWRGNNAHKLLRQAYKLAALSPAIQTPVSWQRCTGSRNKYVWHSRANTQGRGLFQLQTHCLKAQRTINQYESLY